MIDVADETKTRLELLTRAKRSACDCGTWFPWRDKREQGGHWHCYSCELLPKDAVPSRDIDLLDVARAPLHMLRKLLQ